MQVDCAWLCEAIGVFEFPNQMALSPTPPQGVTEHVHREGGGLLEDTKKMYGVWM